MKIFTYILGNIETVTEYKKIVQMKICKIQNKIEKVQAKELRRI